MAVNRRRNFPAGFCRDEFRELLCRLRNRRVQAVQPHVQMIVLGKYPAISTIDRPEIKFHRPFAGVHPMRIHVSNARPNRIGCAFSSNLRTWLLAPSAPMRKLPLNDSPLVETIHPLESRASPITR